MSPFHTSFQGRNPFLLCDKRVLLLSKGWSLNFLLRIESTFHKSRVSVPKTNSNKCTNIPAVHLSKLECFQKVFSTLLYIRSCHYHKRHMCNLINKHTFNTFVTLDFLWKGMSLTVCNLQSRKANNGTFHLVMSKITNLHVMMLHFSSLSIYPIVGGSMNNRLQSCYNRIQLVCRHDMRATGKSMNGNGPFEIGSHSHRFNISIRVGKLIGLNTTLLTVKVKKSNLLWVNVNNIRIKEV